MKPVLELADVSRSFKNFTLEGISFSLPAGYILGYIGANGAGKTTTLNAITHLIRCQGTIRLKGKTFQEDPIGYREQIGYVGDAPYFPEYLRVLDIKQTLKDFYPTFDPDRFEDYLSRWKLPRKEYVRTLSRGMKIRLMFADVLSRDTSLLVLDEATNGLDPLVRREILGIMQEYISTGERSILFSTHLLEDLEQIADYICLIHRGKQLLYEEKERLLERFFLVKGGPKECTPQVRAALLGVTEHAYGFTGLYDSESGAALPSGLTLEKATIDQMSVHLLQTEEVF